MVKCLILCAGYGTRLQQGIEGDQSGKYRHLLGVPKPLVPLGGVPLITHWLNQLAAAGVGPQDVFLVCNQHFHQSFLQWAQQTQFPLDNVINDGTLSNETRLGAVKDIELVVSMKNITEPLVVIGGDTLFFSDFSFVECLKNFKSRPNQSLVLCYHDEMTTRTGILEVDSKGLVTNFLEKPQLTETTSRLACPCFYVLTPDALKYLQEYVQKATSLKDVDATGQFIANLHKVCPVATYKIAGRFDIGALDSYIVANDYFVGLKAKSAKKKKNFVYGFVIVTLLVATATGAYAFLKRKSSVKAESSSN